MIFTAIFYLIRKSAIRVEKVRFTLIFKISRARFVSFQQKEASISSQFLDNLMSLNIDTNYERH